MLILMQFESFVYPSYGQPLISAYGNSFQSVYLALHPFISLPAEVAEQVERYPTEEQIAKFARKCPWEFVAAETGLGTYSKVNQALLTSILAIKAELTDVGARDAVQRLVDDCSIWPPGEGSFETLLANDFLAA